MHSVIMHNFMKGEDELKGRIVSMCLGCVQMVASGTIYVFPAYSSMLAKSGNYSPTEINVIAAMGEWGVYLSVLSGMFYDRKGPRKTLLLAAVLLFTGYAMMYLTIFQMHAMDNFFLVGLYFLLTGQGSAAGYISALATNERNFESRFRGRIVGTQVSFFGAASALWAVIYSVVFYNKGSYLLFFALVLSFITVVCSFGIRRFRESNDVQLASPFRENTRLKWRVFGVLWIVVLSGTASGLLFINNISYLVKSSGAENHVASTVVIVFAIFNCIGRLLFGLGADAARQRWGFTRSVFLLWATALMGAIHCWLIFDLSKHHIIFFAAIVAIAYGGMFSTFPALVREFFDASKFGLYFGMMNASSGVGITILGVVAAKIYESNGGSDCRGSSCFRGAFVITTLLCLVGSLLCVYLVVVEGRVLPVRGYKMDDSQEEELVPIKKNLEEDDEIYEL